jgi:hypothetical protein
MITTAIAAGQSRVKEGQGAVGPRICAADVPGAEIACGVDLGTSVLEGSNVQENWATNFGGVVGGVAATRPGRQRTSLVTLLVAGAAAAPSGAPGADSNGNRLSPHPRPCLCLGRHWRGR